MSIDVSQLGGMYAGKIKLVGTQDGVGVKNAGCAGMAYTMDPVEEVDPKDDVVEDKGVKIFVEPKAILFLLGTEMDYEVTQLKSGFVFNNPNQVSACGCGESVELQAATEKELAARRASVSG